MRKIEFYVPAETEGNPLEQAKPHWVGAAVGLVTAAASAYMNAQQQASTRRNARNASALSGMGGGGQGGSNQPTALSAMAQSKPDNLNQMGFADLLNKQQQGAQFNETPDPFKDQAGFSQDAKPPAPGAASTVATSTAPGTKDPDSRMFSGDDAKGYVGAASSLASIAQGIAQRPQMQGAPIPQPGPMNFQPTALAQLARRNPYGGY